MIPSNWNLLQNEHTPECGILYKLFRNLIFRGHISMTGLRGCLGEQTSHTNQHLHNQCLKDITLLHRGYMMSHLHLRYTCYLSVSQLTGASLSESHMNDMCSRNLYMYVWYIHPSSPCHFIYAVQWSHAMFYTVKSACKNNCDQVYSACETTTCASFTL